MSDRSPPRELRAAVVLPLGDARGDAVDHVRTWAAAQTFPRERYQLVAGTDGSEPAIEQAISGLLAPQDRIVRCPPGTHERGQVDAAARAADAELLLVTENHVDAAPDLVAGAVDRFDREPAVDALLFDYTHEPGSALGAMERRWFEATRVPGHWNSLTSTGFGIRRAAYLAAGGIDGRYGLFAHAVLGLRVHQLGLRVDEAPELRVNHVTSSSFEEHQEHNADWTRGECLFLAEDECPATIERELGHYHLWSNRYGLEPDAERAASGALLRCLARPSRLGSWVRWWRWARPRLAAGLLGPRALLRAAVRRTRRAERQTVRNAGDAERCWPHYLEAWEAVVEQTRLAWLIAHPPAPAAIAPTPPRWAIDDIPAAQRIWFHGRELHGGEPFRWSEPLCLLRLALPPGERRVALETRSLRGPGEHLCAAYWNGRAVAIRHLEGRVELALRVRSAEPGWLALVNEPLGPGDDPRLLGLPLFGLTHAPA